MLRKLHVDLNVLDVLEISEIKLCWLPKAYCIKGLKWSTPWSCWFRSDLQKPNAVLHNVTKLHKKIYKPQFKQIFRVLAFVKAGFYSYGAALTILIYPSVIYSWCYAEMFHDSEGLFAMPTICNLRNIFECHAIRNYIRQFWVDIHTHSSSGNFKIGNPTFNTSVIDSGSCVKSSEWHLCTIWNCT